jgi:hypothetical protein
MCLALDVALLFATASYPQQVKTDYDHKVAFGRDEAYPWPKVEAQDPLLVDRIKGAVTDTPARPPRGTVS